MKVTVISYSYTGNNSALASSIAGALEASHIKIFEGRPRTRRTIFFDVLFNRTPHVNPVPDKMDEYDLIILVGPVWMGQVATPLRAYLQHLKEKPRLYAFVSISGGADGENFKLAGELKRRTGKDPVALIDKHIIDLLPRKPIPHRKDTSSYHLNEPDIKLLTASIVRSLREAMITKKIIQAERMTARSG
jgi:flavodoxin